MSTLTREELENELQKLIQKDNPTKKDKTRISAIKKELEQIEEDEKAQEEEAKAMSKSETPTEKKDMWVWNIFSVRRREMGFIFDYKTPVKIPYEVAIKLLSKKVTVATELVGVKRRRVNKVSIYEPVPENIYSVYKNTKSGKKNRKAGFKPKK